jgi:hypothetical protein
MYSQVAAFWAVTPCNVVVGCHCFRGPFCFQLLHPESALPSETLVMTILSTIKKTAARSFDPNDIYTMAYPKVSGLNR